MHFSDELLKIADKIGLEPRTFLPDGVNNKISIFEKEVNEWNS
jgi:hypothetical protein